MKLVKQLILNIIINWAILFLIERYMPEWFSVNSSWFNTIATFWILWWIFWILNSVVKNIAEVITLPIKYLTFWLSSLAINIWVFYLFKYIINSLDIGIQVILWNIVQVILMSLVILIYYLIKKIIK